MKYCFTTSKWSSKVHLIECSISQVLLHYMKTLIFVMAKIQFALSLRQLKIEGATSLYISKLSSAFFSSVIETGKEFDQVFSANRGFSSGQ